MEGKKTEVDKPVASGGIYSNAPFVNLDLNPFAELKSSVACRLYQFDESEQLVMVAWGLVFPFHADEVVHHAKLVPDNLKVSVDSCVPKYKTLPLPKPSSDVFHDVGSAVGSFVQWPRRLVNIGDEEFHPMRKKNDKLVKGKYVDVNSQKTKDNEVDMERTFRVASRGIYSNAHSAALDADPFAELKIPVACRLYQFDESEQLVMVARGLVFPFRADEVVHHAKLEPGNLKVSVDSCIPKYKTLPLPKFSSDVHDVGGAVGTFVQWPRQLVI